MDTTQACPVKQFCTYYRQMVRLLDVCMIRLTCLSWGRTPGIQVILTEQVLPMSTLSYSRQYSQSPWTSWFVSQSISVGFNIVSVSKWTTALFRPWKVNEILENYSDESFGQVIQDKELKHTRTHISQKRKQTNRITQFSQTFTHIFL